MTDVTSDEVLQFWLGPEAERDAPASELKQRWYKKSDAFDAEIRERFAEAVTAAGSGELDAWRATTRGTLALVILLDQFTRNIYRDDAGMYDYDELAQNLVLEQLEAGTDRTLHASERQFLYMPLMHAEDRALQDRSVELFAELQAEHPSVGDLVGYAERHRVIVQRFGRFPHRNTILGRTCTGDEIDFLQKPGSSF